MIGEFNGWNEGKHCSMGAWSLWVFYEAFVREAKVGILYKFLIHARDGRKLYKADPLRIPLSCGGNASIADIPNFRWGDSMDGKSRNCRM